ncbi:hypothetical protein JRI60_48715 [Archangium violaceum]|uniref:hypothetical protein n=1 Tax=Archangium violaceum TaxID=83451 RepID=UPI0019506C38|nr:hypothetical protein [Archangium violaceum]QRN96784.1 hypothetical protein JRI60_48715 [Archangium violaceum]
MRNPTSMESSADASADLQGARQGCIELGRQAESVAELVFPLLRQATQELNRLETQRDELRKTAATRETPPTVLNRLNDRIEEQGQGVKRLERASRGLKELISGLGGLGERLRNGLARRDEEQRELEAIAREEKRMWLRELETLREQARGQAGASGPSPAQQEELQRLRAESEGLPKLRAERDRLAHRVAELEKGLAEREQTLTAKEQTIEDLRRMIVLLTGDSAAASTPSTPTAPKPVPAPVSVVPLGTSSKTPAAQAPKPKASNTMFGNSTMQLADSLLETLGESAPDMPYTPPPISVEPLAPDNRPPSMEIMLGPLDELVAPPPAAPPPVPALPLAPLVPPVAPLSTMPKASARVAPPPPSKTPAPLPGMAMKVVSRPGTLVISEDMFNDMLVEEKDLGGPGKK